MFDFFGKFHPLFVHLPIGFLVLAFAFYLMSLLNEKWRHLQDFLPLVLLFTFGFSVFTCITGYVLSLSGGYQASLVQKHKWAGIVLTAISGVGYLVLSQSKVSKISKRVLWGTLMLVTMLTGHWGGSLTHGENYLSLEAKKVRQPIKDIQKAHLYADVVSPILEDKCYACHSSSKQKGLLRLDSKEYILKGGEHGEVVHMHASAESELYNRLLLPEVEEEHMPPKGKPQPTESETKVLAWWIDEGLDFERTVEELKPTAEMLEVLKKFEGTGQKDIRDFPEKNVAKGDQEAIKSLRNLGAIVIPISKESNYLSVNFLEKSIIDQKALTSLEKLQDQVVWLKLDGTNVKNEDLKSIGKLKNLYILHLNQTEVGDEGLGHLKGLGQLRILNLAFTKVGNEGLGQLKALPKLLELFLYKTPVSDTNWKETFPHTRIDTGGYENWFVVDSLHEPA